MQGWGRGVRWVGVKTNCDTARDVLVATWSPVEQVAPAHQLGDQDHLLVRLKHLRGIQHLGETSNMWACRTRVRRVGRKT